MRPTISVVIDLPTDAGSGRATVDALAHADDANGAGLVVEIVPTATITPAFIASPGPVFIGPGGPYDRPDLVEAVIRSAREQGIPLVGT